MIDDKYIGLIIAISGNVFIGSSFIFTKKVCLTSCRDFSSVCLRISSPRVSYMPEMQAMGQPRINSRTSGVRYGGRA